MQLSPLNLGHTDIPNDAEQSAAITAALATAATAASTAIATAAAAALAAYETLVPTTGFTKTFAAGKTRLVLNPAGTLATGTITLPAAQTDGMEVEIYSSQEITALTLDGNVTTFLVAAPTTIAAGGKLRFKRVTIGGTNYWIQI